MFDYLQQFNRLPKELKEKVSSPRAMEILSSLEKKYNVNLAMVTMQIMVKQILFKDLPAYFSSEMGLELVQAKALSEDLKEKLFFSLATYLGLRPQVRLTPEEKELEQLMKDNNIILASQELLSRSRNILITYRKGVRSKIDTRAALEKSVEHGGIGLDSQMAEKLLNIMDVKDVGQAIEPAMIAKDISNLVSLPSDEAQKEIDQLINREELAAGYDLKKNLESGNLQVPTELAAKFKSQEKPLDPSRELKAPEKILALKSPEDKVELESSVHLDLGKEPQTIAPEEETLVSTIELKSANLNIEPPLTKEIDQALPAEKLKQLANLAPEATDLKSSFKKPHTDKDERGANFFTKIFQAKGAKDKTMPSPLAGMKSSHLEAMVKAASMESKMRPRPAASSDSRPKMHDVKVKPKMMGPLEELRYLDLTNFRRLGDNPEQITSKIISKIRILKKDGYDKMVLGVQAWRQSPVNRSYIRLMQEAVVKGITIDELLEARAEQDKSGLNKGEITAIVEMNSKLLY